MPWDTGKNILSPLDLILSTVSRSVVTQAYAVALGIYILHYGYWSFKHVQAQYAALNTQTFSSIGPVQKHFVNEAIVAF